MWIALFVAGCVHPVEIVSVPTGAAIIRDDPAAATTGEKAVGTTAAVGTTPTVLDVSAPITVTARLPGYRDLT